MLDALHLKRTKTSEIYDTFQDEKQEITLILTGVGKVHAAVAVSHICTKYQVGAEDFLLHIGSCAGREAGKVYAGNQIQDWETGRCYYPDILFWHELPERGIVTVGKVLEEGLPDVKEQYDIKEDLPEKEKQYDLRRNLSESEILYDMEASGVYQGCIPYLGQHQMAFLKVVSDVGEGRGVTPEKLRMLMEKNIPEIVRFIDGIRGYVDSLRRSKPDDAEIQWREKLYQAIHCSATMRFQAEQLLHYFWLSGRDYHAVLEEDFQSGVLPCKDRKEGKKYLEEFKRRLL